MNVICLCICIVTCIFIIDIVLLLLYLTTQKKFVNLIRDFQNMLRTHTILGINVRCTPLALTHKCQGLILYMECIVCDCECKMCYHTPNGPNQGGEGGVSDYKISQTTIITLIITNITTNSTQICMISNYRTTFTMQEDIWYIHLQHGWYLYIMFQ